MFHSVKSRSFIVAASMALAVIGILSTQVWAQKATGQVNGTVTDQTGAVLPGVEVTIENLDTGVQRTVITGNSGTYTIPSVLSGRYSLTAALPGFQRAVVSSFRLQLNESRTIDLEMSLGEITQQVTVQGLATPINKTDATISNVIQNEEMEEIPLNGRHFTQLAILAPGVGPVQSGQQNLFTITPGGFSPSVNGMRSQMNNFTLDGMDNNARFSNAFGASPPPDAIQEFNVQSHQTDADASFAAGGNLNVTTKSGGNEFHGTLWEFHRNDALTANNFFDNFFGRETVPFKQNQYGFAAGGPVWIPAVLDGRESKTYFFTYFEGFKRRRDSLTQGNVPNTAMKGGDFSQLLGDQVGLDELGRPVFAGQIFDPETGRACAACASGWIRDPFPGNVIPSDRIHPVAQTYLSAIYPQPNRDDLPNLVLAQSAKFDGWQFGFRIDHNFSESRRLYGRFSQYNNEETSPGALPSIGLTRINHGVNTMAHWTEVISPTFLFDIQFGYNRTGIPFRNDPQPESFRNAVGDDFIFEVSGEFVPASMQLPGSQFTSANWVAWELANPDDSYQLNSDFKKIVGDHQFDFGHKIFHWRHITVEQGSKRLAFISQTTDQPGFPAAGEPLASFMIGYPETSENALFPFIKNWGWINISYFQHRWKVTPKLSLNWGLQYLYSTQPRMIGDRFSMFDYGTAFQQPDATDFAFAYVWAGDNPITGEPSNAEYPGTIIPPDRNNFAPRLGIAYSINEDTVFRVGGGVFYDFNQNLVQNTQARKGTTRWPYGEFTRISGENVLQLTDRSLDSPFPDPRPVAPSATAGGDFFQRDPYAFNWNLGIQRQLPFDTALTVEYVGSVARKMPLNKAINLAPNPSPEPVAPRRPLHNIGAQIMQDDDGSSNYNALQLKLQRRFKDGLTFRTSYTYSKALDYQTDANGISNGLASLFLEYGPTIFNLPHNFTFSYVYQLPFGHGSRWGGDWAGPVNAILGGWQTSGIVTLRSGLPYNPVAGQDIANVGNRFAAGIQRPNRIGEPFPSGFEITPDAGFDTSAFAQPEFGTAGNLTRNALMGPSYQTLDFSMQKNFHFTETVNLQFRFEGFNILNHTNLGNPATNIRTPTFGQIRSAFAARDIQFGLKLFW